MKFTPAGEQRILEISERSGFSRDAVTTMLEALIGGNGSMAQFNHAEFGGHGQWMRGGMTMVSDMFNAALKGRINRLCSELARSLADHESRSIEDSGTRLRDNDNANSDPGTGSGASLFVPAEPRISRNWWPTELGTPSRTGAQNNVRYAYFAQANRLAIELFGQTKVYDTLDHQITGFSQQQSFDGSVTFRSQHGVVEVAALPIIGTSQSGSEHSR